MSQLEEGDQMSSNQPDQNLPPQEETEEQTTVPDQIVEGHVRGFYNDQFGGAKNKLTSNFALGYDITTSEEKQRRIDRLHRFNAEGASTAQIQRLEQAQIDQFDANKRLARFTADIEASMSSTISSSTSAHSSLNGTETDSLGLPEIMPFEDLQDIPQDQIQAELHGFEPFSARRWDTIHLFGTRFLRENVRTEDLFHYYSDMGLQRVEWQSDYRCNLVFIDQFAARRILDGESYCLDINVLRAKKIFPLISTQKSDEENATSFQPEVLPFLVWRQSSLNRDYDEAQGTMVYRIATENDIKQPLEARKHSRFYLDNLQYFKKLIRNRREALDKANQAAEFAAQKRIDSAIEGGESEEVIQQLRDELEAVQNSSIKAVSEMKVEMLKSQQLPTKPAQSNHNPSENDQNMNVDNKPAQPAPPPGARGRGFAKGRQGAFSTGVQVQKPGSMHSMNDQPHHRERNRERDRQYTPLPHVSEATPLMTTVTAIQQNLDVRRERDVIKEQKQQLQAIKRGNNLLTRVPVNYQELRKGVELPPERAPRQTSEFPQEIVLETTGLSAMFMADQLERELKQQEEEMLKALKEQEAFAALQQQQQQQEQHGASGTQGLQDELVDEAYHETAM